MLGKFHGQFGTADVDEAGIILHLITHGHLPAGHPLFNQRRLQCRPHGINGRGESSRATADDNQIV